MGEIKKAGVDAGSTLIKLVSIESGQSGYVGSSFPNDGNGWLRIVEILKDEKVKQVNLAGIRQTEAKSCLSGFKVVTIGGYDLIEQEVELQADGTRRLVALKSNDGPESFILVGLGTGISYAVVRGKKVQKFPIGSALGGGFIEAQGKLMHCGSFSEIISCAKSCGGFIRSEDLLVRNVWPEAPDSLGWVPIAYFGRFNNSEQNISQSLFCATVIHCVVMNIVRDVYMMKLAGYGDDIKDVVVVGSAAAPLITDWLNRLMLQLQGTKVTVPWRNNLALAVGAYHMDEKP